LDESIQGIEKANSQKDRLQQKIRRKGGGTLFLFLKL
jgi:hypothetical protein